MMAHRIRTVDLRSIPPRTGLRCARTQRPQLSREFIQPLGGKTPKKPPLEGFFSLYPNFQFQPSNSPDAEFRRLCETYCWKRDDKIAQRKAFRIAMEEEFDARDGSDEKDLNNWRKLCHILKIDPVPDTIQKCRAAALRKHVNLVDLFQALLGSKGEVRIFKTEKELSEYTKLTGKYFPGTYFPKEVMRDGGIWRDLLRQILVPRESMSSSRRKKGSKRK